MVRSVTSFGRSGLSDWLVQRVTSIILLAYFVFLAATLVQGVDYDSWQRLFDHTAMKVFTLLAVLSLAAHAWIGLWAVYTDYLTERLLGGLGNVLRIFCQLGIVLALIILVMWTVLVIWS